MTLLGDFSDLPLPDVLVLISGRGMSGRLTLQSGDESATLIFQRGRLIHVTATQTSQPLGQLLLRMRKLAAAHLSAALAMQSRLAMAMPLGMVLVEQGWTTSQDLDAALAAQAEQTLNHLLTWSHGLFTFTAIDTGAIRLPLRDINIQKIILEASCRRDEWAQVQAAIPSLDCCVSLIDNPARFGLSDPSRVKEQMVITSILEGALTLRDIAAATGLGNDEVMRLVYTLAVEELIAISRPRLALSSSALAPTT